MADAKLWATLRKLGRRPDGVSTAEIAAAVSCTRPAAGRACQSLLSRGDFVVLKISHKYCRYFVAQAQLNAYKVKLDNNMVRALRVKRAAAGGGLKANWAPDEKVVVPRHVKVQIGATHDPRNTMFEFPFIHTRKGL